MSQNEYKFGKKSVPFDEFYSDCGLGKVQYRRHMLSENGLEIQGDAFESRD